LFDAERDSTHEYISKQYVPIDFPKASKIMFTYQTADFSKQSMNYREENILAEI
jgi:hypothetical protein